jgi:peptidoglycan/xylan/chitin deacetylase (PgdA/CDA1 family)
VAAGAGLALRRLAGKVVILAYHRVLPASALREAFVQPGMYVRDTVFEMHVRFLREHFDLLPLGELLRLWTSGGFDERSRYAVLTFDDGWRDNYLYALPVLARHHAPASIFLATDLIGTARWFWPERLAYVMHREERPPAPADVDRAITRFKELPEGDVERVVEARADAARVTLPTERLLLSWEEVEEMSRHGITFGSHSRTHRILTRLPSDELTREVAGSLAALDRPGVAAIPVFAYPNGNRDGETAARVRDAGYAAALGSGPGPEGRVPSDLFGLRRVGIHDDVSATPALFQARLAGLDRPAAWLGRGAARWC